MLLNADFDGLCALLEHFRLIIVCSNSFFKFCFQRSVAWVPVIFKFVVVRNRQGQILYAAIALKILQYRTVI